MQYGRRVKWKSRYPRHEGRRVMRKSRCPRQGAEGKEGNCARGHKVEEEVQVS